FIEFGFHAPKSATDVSARAPFPPATILCLGEIPFTAEGSIDIRAVQLTDTGANVYGRGSYYLIWWDPLDPWHKNVQRKSDVRALAPVENVPDSQIDVPRCVHGRIKEQAATAALN